MSLHLPDSDTAEFLSALIQEHSETRSRFSQYLIDQLPSDQQTQALKRELGALLDHNQCNPLPAAMAWWPQAQVSDSAELRFRRLHLLLDNLDTWYSTKPLLRLATADQRFLVVGRRWWNQVCRMRTQGRGLLDEGPPFAVDQPFPHIRTALKHPEEWLSTYGAKEAFTPVLREGVLRIGLCSLTGKALTYFAGTRVLNPERSVYGFRAHHIATCASEASPAPDLAADPSQENVYFDELRQVIEWCRRERVHILCLPELSVCEQGRELLKREIALDRGSLCLIVPGSYHDPCATSRNFWINAAPIWLVTAGGIQECPPFEKSQAFSMKVEKAQTWPVMIDTCRLASQAGCESLQEHIRPGSRLRAVVTPVGIVGVAICKDALVSSGLMQRYRELADHLLIVSFNGSPQAWFAGSAQEGARSQSIATFYVNARQSVDPGNSAVDMIFWHLPYIGKDIIKSVHFRCQPGNNTECRILSAPGREVFELAIPEELLT